MDKPVLKVWPWCGKLLNPNSMAHDSPYDKFNWVARLVQGDDEYVVASDFNLESDLGSFIYRPSPDSFLWDLSPWFWNALPLHQPITTVWGETDDIWFAFRRDGDGHHILTDDEVNQ
jgi:hypothetical protein